MQSEKELTQERGNKMYISKIVNPKTHKNNKVKVFEISSKEAISILNKEGVKALSWELLSQKESVQVMENQFSGDSANNNFALSVFENALDFSLGMLVHAYLKHFTAKYVGKVPVTVRIAVNRSGDCYIVGKQLETGFSNPIFA